MLYLPSEEEGKENKQREKNEEGTQKALVNRGRNNSVFFFFLDVYLNMAQIKSGSL